MTSPSSALNRRILVIDDNPSIHDDFRKILCPTGSSGSLDQARAVLFGEEPTLPVEEAYELDSTDQGQKGLGLVHCAIQEGRPYALAFVDMRMPPGWDGLETIEQLWAVAQDLEVVICTAYSDHPWEDVSRRIGQSDKLLILMKPFNSVEVTQLARALTAKWNLKRQVQQQIDSLASCVSQRTAELRAANERIQEQIADRATAVSDPLQQKEEFLAIMSHEVLGPLSTLTDTVALLLQDSPTGAVKGHVATLQKSVQDITALITDMHTFLSAGRSGAASTPHM